MIRQHKKIISKICAIVLFLCQVNGFVYAQEQAVLQNEQAGITVTTLEQFKSALAQECNLIIVDGTITLSNGADSNGKMYPIEIPGNKTITATSDGMLVARCPIQISGDDVVFKDIEMVFNSSTALGSVAHREIFLAGHSLTLDNVSTYLEGSDGSLGSFGGSEAELLPTVYAGGFEGTGISDQASLTLINSNKDTVFAGIYMGHEEESDNKTPYKGNAVVRIDENAAVREGIYTDMNSEAQVVVSAGAVQSQLKVVKVSKFKGNATTSLALNRVWIQDAIVDGIENVELDNKACLGMHQDSPDLKNVSLINGACLDYNEVTSATITGYLKGSEESQSEEKGILVLNKDGVLEIKGKVSGTTQLQTGGQSIAGSVYMDKAYIRAEKNSETDFVLHENYVNNGFGLSYENGAWTTYSDYMGLPISKIEVVSAPAVIDINAIMRKGGNVIPATSAFVKIAWFDENEGLYDLDIVEQQWFYGYDYILGIKTEYWESDSEEILDKTDWSNYIEFISAPEEYPGQYFFQANEGVQTGAYTFLFCSRYYESIPESVRDVKNLSVNVLAELKVLFYDSTIEDYPPVVSEEPEASEEPEESANPPSEAPPSEEPETSEEPEVSEEPEESVNPPSEEPETSEEPMISEEPEVSEEPEISENPPSANPPSEAPPSEEPEVSEEPVISEEPLISANPPSEAPPSEEPEVSENPPSEEPEESANPPGEEPEGSEEPETSEEPMISEEPEVSDEPEGSEEPELPIESEEVKESQLPIESEEVIESQLPIESEEVKESQLPVEPEVSEEPEESEEPPSEEPPSENLPSEAPPSENPPSANPPSANPPSANPPSEEPPSTTPGSGEGVTFVIGDVTGDGKVTLQDAQLVLRAALLLDEFTEKQIKAADVNRSGHIELEDARRVLRAALLLESLETG